MADSVTYLSPDEFDAELEQIQARIEARKVAQRVSRKAVKMVFQYGLAEAQRRAYASKGRDRSALLAFLRNVEAR